MRIRPPAPGAAGPSFESDDFRFVAPTDGSSQPSTDAISSADDGIVLYVANQPLQ